MESISNTPTNKNQTSRLEGTEFYVSGENIFVYTGESIQGYKASTGEKIDHKPSLEFLRKLGESIKINNENEFNMRFPNIKLENIA